MFLSVYAVALLSPLGGSLFISSPFEGGAYLFQAHLKGELNRDGGAYLRGGAYSI